MLDPGHTCAICNEKKPLGEFYTYAKVYKGRESYYVRDYCRACDNALRAENYRRQRARETETA